MASTYVKYLKEAVTTAAQWKHVVFIVLPMPFAHADVSRFESYMNEFNVDPPKLKNVVSSEFLKMVLVFGVLPALETVLTVPVLALAGRQLALQGLSFLALARSQRGCG